MLVSSIDIMNGAAVQLIGGKVLEINAGDPNPIAKKLSIGGELAVIDLDAAMGRTPNTEVISKIVKDYPCRVGGGIRDIETARYWLNLGANSVIIGTAASPELLCQLPRDRVIAALDTKQGIVMSHGWKESTGETIESAMQRLRPYVGGFLVTTIEREGRLLGLDLKTPKFLKELAGDSRLTVAGGVSSAEEVARLDAEDIDVQAGMALYKGVFSGADCFIATLTARTQTTEWPTVVCDQAGRCLGLVYSNPESLQEAFRSGKGVYWSRKRGLWIKGLTSGATQTLLRVELDCDRDSLKFIVKQDGPGFCHRLVPTCWQSLSGMQKLEKAVQTSIQNEDPLSYSRRLLRDAGLLNLKLEEEAKELAETNMQDKESVLSEASDLFYFMYMKLRQSGLVIDDLDKMLSIRAARVTRRFGNAKTKASLSKTLQSYEGANP